MGRVAHLLALVASIASVAASPPATPLEARRAEQPPQLEWHAPGEMAPHARQLERVDATRLLAVMRLVGLEDPGPPIHVVLAAEASPLASRVPPWIAGYAVDGGVVVMIPSRTPSYPHESMVQLLQHEVAHVLITRAVGGRPVPRWFHEGVALAAERTWSLSDRAYVAYEIALGGVTPVHAVDALFTAGPGPASRAYSLSGALVGDLLETHGPGFAARLLARMREGEGFDSAFFATTGTTVDEAGQAFWSRRRLWVAWLPWLTSPAVVYAAMTLLALAAIRRARSRRSARRAPPEPPAAAD